MHFPNPTLAKRRTKIKELKKERLDDPFGSLKLGISSTPDNMSWAHTHIFFLVFFCFCSIRGKISQSRGKKARNLAIVIFNYFILSIWAIFFLSLGRFHSIFFSVRWAVVTTIDGGGRSWWWWCWWQMGGMMGGLRYLSTLVHTPWRVFVFFFG